MNEVESRGRLREITARIEEIGSQAGRMMWELGALLTEVEVGELWRATPHAGFLEWVDAELKFSRQTARKYQRIHQHFSADMAERFGSEKLDAGLAFLTQTRRDEQPGDLVATAIPLRTAQGTFATVPFPKASVRQIQAATRALKARGSPAPPPEAVARADRLHAALAGAGLGRVQLAVGADGAARYSFHDVPAGDLHRLIALLQAHLPA